MSSGFPNIPARAAFGPEMKNVRRPANSETDLSADQMNLLFWQLAGAGRTVPQAVLVLDGVNTVLLYQALAFDARQELSTPVVVVKGGTGLFDFTFASTYADQKGVPVSFTPRTAMVQVQGGAVNDSVQFSISGQTVSVEARDSAGVLKDLTFVLRVWGN